MRSFSICKVNTEKLFRCSMLLQAEIKFKLFYNLCNRVVNKNIFCAQWIFQAFVFSIIIFFIFCLCHQLHVLIGILLGTTNYGRKPGHYFDVLCQKNFYIYLYSIYIIYLDYQKFWSHHFNLDWIACITF